MKKILMILIFAILMVVPHFFGIVSFLPNPYFNNVYIFLGTSIILYSVFEMLCKKITKIPDVTYIKNIIDKIDKLNDKLDNILKGDFHG